MNTYPECFQVSHVEDQDVGMNCSQPQWMAVVPLGKVIRRKPFLFPFLVSFVVAIVVVVVVVRRICFGD